MTDPDSPTDEAVRVTIVLADDHAVVRSGLRMLLEAEPGHEVLAEAATAEDALRYTPEIAELDCDPVIGPGRHAGGRRPGAYRPAASAPALRSAGPLSTPLCSFSAALDPLWWRRSRLRLQAGTTPRAASSS